MYNEFIEVTTIEGTEHRFQMDDEKSAKVFAKANIRKYVEENHPDTAFDFAWVDGNESVFAVNLYRDKILSPEVLLTPIMVKEGE